MLGPGEKTSEGEELDFRASLAAMRRACSRDQWVFFEQIRMLRGALYFLNKEATEAISNWRPVFARLSTLMAKAISGPVSAILHLQGSHRRRTLKTRYLTSGVDICNTLLHLNRLSAYGS